MKKEPKRFVWVEPEGFIKGTSIIVDTQTGVNYLFVWAQAGYAGGLTPLIDENGKPVVTKNIVEK